MAIKDLDQKLNSLLWEDDNSWKNKARDRAKNKAWLKHSRCIAFKINEALKEKGIKQKELAVLLDVSPQQVSKILKGRENLTLETISKIETALSIDILSLEKTSNAEINKTKKSQLFKATPFKGSYKPYGKVFKMILEEPTSKYSSYNLNNE